MNVLEYHSIVNFCYKKAYVLFFREYDGKEIILVVLNSRKIILHFIHEIDSGLVKLTNRQTLQHAIALNSK